MYTLDQIRLLFIKIINNYLAEFKKDKYPPLTTQGFRATHVKKCKLPSLHILTVVLNEATLNVNIIYKNQTRVLVHSSNAMSINTKTTTST